MATFTKRGKSWTVQVRKSGQSHTATFSNKVAAQEWAAKVEADILAGKLGKSPDKTFSELLDRYIKEVVPVKRGERSERLRLEKIKRDIKLSSVKLSDLTADHFSDWRDRRLAEVSAASVTREFTTLSHACSVAVKEWRWLQSNPLSVVRRPPETPPRQKLITQDEIERILLCCGTDYTKSMGRVGLAFRFALETAMRAGEICDLEWQHVHERYAHVRQRNDLGKLVTKNGENRDVPLSSKAREVIEIVRLLDHVKVFGLSTSTLDTLFRRVKERAGITDLHFHDSRAYALTNLSKKLNVLQLAKVSGHRDLSILRSVYYRESVDDIAELIG